MWPGDSSESAGFFCGPTGGVEDESVDQVQARIHLARRVRARSEPSRQDAGQGVRELPIPRGAPGLGLRRQLDAPGPKAAARTVCLQPVAVFADPAKTDAALVMCEVLMPDMTPHPSNSRATIPDDPDTWFGFEQEYFLYRDNVPLGFPQQGFPPPQGEYYTGVGYKNVGEVAPRDRRCAPRPLPSRPASTTRASTPRSRRVSGSSRSSARARSGPPTRCGWRGICSCACVRSTAST